MSCGAQALKLGSSEQEEGSLVSAEL
jgi:hypothetical protein